MQRLIPLVHRPSPARTIQKQSKRIATDIGLPTLISSKGVPRNADVGRKKRCRKGCTSVPEAQKLKMKQMHIAGMNISEIAEETGRHWRTVNRIVKESDVAEYMKGLREKFYGQLDELLLAAIIGAKTQDARLAYKMVCDAGLLPPLSSNANFNMSQQQPNTPEAEMDAVKRIAVALVQGAIERHKSFGLPLPEADAIEAELKAKGEIGG
jgi:hypothetical protein